MKYTIRLAANASLERDIEELLAARSGGSQSKREWGAAALRCVLFGRLRLLKIPCHRGERPPERGARAAKTVRQGQRVFLRQLMNLWAPRERTALFNNSDSPRRLREESDP